MIDSSVMIDLERKGLSLASVRQDDDEPWAMSAVTVSEFLFGLHRAQTSEQRSRRQEFLDNALAQLPVVPFDLKAAEVHASIWSQLVASGQTIGVHDFIIAATALAHDFEVMTLNVREFSRVPGLDVRQPDW